MSVKIIQEEIKDLRLQLRVLEKTLVNLQTECNHVFTDFKNYQICKLCKKTEPLYY